MSWVKTARTALLCVMVAGAGGLTIAGRGGAVEAETDASTGLGMGGVISAAPILLGLNGEVYAYETRVVDPATNGAPVTPADAPLMLSATLEVSVDARAVLLRFVLENPDSNDPVSLRFLFYVDPDLSLPMDTSLDDLASVVGVAAPGGSYQVGDQLASTVLDGFDGGQLDGSVSSGEQDVAVAVSFDDTIDPGGRIGYVVELREGGAAATDDLQIVVSDADLPLSITIAPRREPLAP